MVNPGGKNLCWSLPEELKEGTCSGPILSVVNKVWSETCRGHLDVIVIWRNITGKGKWPKTGKAFRYLFCPILSLTFYLTCSQMVSSSLSLYVVCERIICPSASWPSNVTTLPHISHVTCHMSHGTCHMSQLHPTGIPSCHSSLSSYSYNLRLETDKSNQTTIESQKVQHPTGAFLYLLHSKSPACKWSYFFSLISTNVTSYSRISIS